MKKIKVRKISRYKQKEYDPKNKKQVKKNKIAELLQNYCEKRKWHFALFDFQNLKVPQKKIPKNDFHNNFSTIKYNT